MKNKKSYRQSSLYNFFDCPYKFVLSTQHDIPSTTAMDDGRLFEAMVLGAKNDVEFEELFGKKRSKTIESYNRITDPIKSMILDGTPYRKMSYESENWILKGEADFIGNVTILGKTYKTILDLKFTSNISKIWMEKTEKRDFLQAVTYQFLWYKETGELLPFTYLCVENVKTLQDGVLPMMKVYLIQPSMESFEWLTNLVDCVDEMETFSPNMNSCEDGLYKTRCKYMMFCEFGRSVIESPVEINFMELIG